MKIKKILLTFPVIFTLVLSLCCFFSASAADSIDTSSSGYVGDYSGSLDFYTVDDFKDYYNCTSSTSFIFISSELYYSKPFNIFYLDAAFFYSNDSSISFSVDFSDGVYTIIPSSAIYFSSAYHTYYLDSDSSLVPGSGDSFCDSTQSKRINKLVIDTTSNSLSGYFNDSYVNLCTTCGANPVKYTCIDSNIDNIPIFTNGLNVDVSFTPDLSGVIDRSVEVSGITYNSTGFTMQVTNKSGKAIQYRMAILPEGQTEIKNSAPDSSSDFDTIFYYYSNEWVYDRSLDSELDYANDGYNKYQKASCWHYVSKGGSDVQRFKWSQIPINENTVYTVVVQAILTDYDLASQIFVSSATSEAAYPEYKQLLYDDCSYVYSSQFNVSYLGDVQYDSSDTSNCIVPYSSNSDFQRYSYSYNAIENSDGTINYENKNLYDDSSSWVHNGTLGSGFNNYSSNASVNHSFDTFLSSSQSYLAFLNSAFNFFPDWIWGTISIGFFTVIIIGIIKRLG